MRAAFSPVPVLLFALAGGYASAQTVSFDTLASVQRSMARDLTNAPCPMNFSAQRYGLAATLRRTARGQVEDFTPSLRLRFGRLDLVRSLEVVVHGRPANAEALPIGTELPETASQTFRFSRSEDRFDPIQFVQTTTVPLITRLEMTRVEYTDARIWREPSSGSCSIEPSPFVLVNAEAQ